MAAGQQSLASFVSDIGFRIDDSAIDALRKKVQDLNKELVRTLRLSMKAAAKDLKGANKIVGQINTNSLQVAKEQVKLERERVKLTREQLRATERQAHHEASKPKHSHFMGGFGAGGVTGGLHAMGGPAAAAFGGFVLGRSVFKTGNLLQGSRAALDFITGSKEGGAEEMKFVRKEVDRLSMSLPDTVQNYQQLLASAKDRIGIQNTRDLFSGFSEVATVLNLTNDAQERAIRAFGQMASKGKITSEELKGQLAEALPGAVNILAKALNMTTDELFAGMEKGQVKADALVKVAQHLKSLTTAEQRAAALQTPAKQLNVLATAWTDFTDALGKSGFYELLAELFKFLAGAMKALTPALKLLTPVFKAFNTALRFTKELIEAIVTSVESLFKVFTYLAASIWKIFGSGGGATLGIAGVLTLIATKFELLLAFGAKWRVMFTAMGRVLLAFTSLLARVFVMWLGPIMLIEELTGFMSGKGSALEAMAIKEMGEDPGGESSWGGAVLNALNFIASLLKIAVLTLRGLFAWATGDTFSGIVQAIKETVVMTEIESIAMGRGGKQMDPMGAIASRMVYLQEGENKDRAMALLRGVGLRNPANMPEFHRKALVSQQSSAPVITVPINIENVGNLGSQADIEKIKQGFSETMQSVMQTQVLPLLIKQDMANYPDGG